MLAEMTGDFPKLYEIIVKERDAYLARSLRLAAIPREVTEPDGGMFTHCLVYKLHAVMKIIAHFVLGNLNLERHLIEILLGKKLV